MAPVILSASDEDALRTSTRARREVRTNSAGPCASSPLRLGHAEPIPRIILHNRLNPVKLLLRRRREFHALGFQLLVSLLAVAGLQYPTLDLAFRQQRTNRRGHLGLHVRS